MQLRPPSGHLGQRSPRRKRTINMLDDLSPIKLRSPMKRTMNELDQAAVQRAMQIRFKSVVPDYNDNEIDEDRELIEDEDMALADKIIALSKKDNYESMHMESDDSDREVGDEKFVGYFEQQKLRAKKLSTNSMTMAPQVSYDEFHAYNKLANFMCLGQKTNLIEYYRQQYTQWLFELQEGFNIIFYGVGSKRRLILDFVQSFLLERVSKSTKCVVANGYNSELDPRALLKFIWKLMFNKKPPTWHMVDSVRELKTAFNKFVDRKKLIIVLPQHRRGVTEKR
ncbi:hypothetical protein HII12_003144 [Brettanomyces bruxellensis]|uniref:Origin recognition complex subunit 2 n=1 Tax=Dekkera bruxellensis TaxID=5007 RepID=A0A8H6BDF5_DEKBR|nr:hypothetical protein HII12_003144 [Brettanomyces bruxellensis]